jgi:2-polyprenyl-3-methyl-5-hydroxy-6-metoxy-1,4-benzoquinol methylase
MEVNKDYFNEAYFESGKTSNYKNYFDYPFFKDLAYFLWEKYLPKSVLEVGCAKGFLIKWLRRLRVDAIGLDISQYAVDNAPEDVKDYVQCVDFSSDKVINNIHFDLVVSFETIEHIPDNKLKQFIKNLYDATNDWCILSTPIVPRGYPSTDGGLDKSHVSLHSKDYWCDAFKAVGFEFLGWVDWVIPKMETFGAFVEHNEGDPEITDENWNIKNVMIMRKKK